LGERGVIAVTAEIRRLDWIESEVCDEVPIAERNEVGIRCVDFDAPPDGTSSRAGSSCCAREAQHGDEEEPPSSHGRFASSTVAVIGLPSRRTVTSTLSPGFLSRSANVKS